MTSVRTSGEMRPLITILLSADSNGCRWIGQRVPIDVVLECPTAQQVSSDVSEPEALAQIVKTLCRFHVAPQFHGITLQAESYFSLLECNPMPLRRCGSEVRSATWS